MKMKINSDYELIDSWVKNNNFYSVGSLTEDNEIYYIAEVIDNNTTYSYECDNAIREEIESIHLNNISQIDIDRHEAETFKKLGL